ncbi:hypothetical protein Mth01_48330 [Sphaerimonospora thailandensis]|uniref:BD-FAE-like domain-containing protein n=2 Tax=Sphaerimonospora thailandensis TaxID=795644 RepID=A0A8J3RD51_9ACTN|nr:hypothetical protein Mth01_48330 [Sphaerimonospora thailandensis]
MDLEPLACALVELGYRVAVVEYRPCWDGGAWPTAVHDCRDSLRALASQGEHWEDAVLVGHSAGAHLLLSAVAGSGAASMLLLAPVAELERAAALDVGKGAVAGFLAAHLASGGGIADATPRITARDVESVTVVAAGCDQAVPAELTDHQQLWLESQGVPARLVQVAGARHMHLVNPDRPAHRTVLRELAELASRIPAPGGRR